MRKLSGFSLMEMMIVMLIVAVVAAASAPMINKKMLQDQANVSPWVWTGSDNSIAYNLKGSDNQAAVIGAIIAPKKTNGDAISKLHIVSDGTQLTLSKKTPPKHFHFRVTENAVHIIDDISKTGANSVTIGPGASSFGAGNNVAIGMKADTKFFSTAIGSNAKATERSATAIGYKATATGIGSIAIGGGQTSDDVNTLTSATGTGAIAIGQQAFSSATGAIAIGNSAEAETTDATASDSSAEDETTGVTALGSSAEAKGNNTTAIGYNAKAKTNENTTALGSSSEAIGENATAIGSNAKAKIDSSIALGYGAVVQEKGNSSGGIAIGSSVYVAPGCVGIGSSAFPDDYSTGQKSVSIGEVSNSGKNAVAIGIGDSDGGYPGENGASSSETSTSDYSVAIGAGVSAGGNNSIAIGRRTFTFNNNSIAIGAGASVSAEKSVAIGAGATVINGAKNAVAIGTGVVANYENEIVLGHSGSTVYIPGRLVVKGRAAIGLDNWDTIINVGNGEKPMAIRRQDYIRRHTQWDDIKGEFNYNATSDRRLKNVGEAFKGGLAEIKKLEVFNYTFKKDPDKTPRVGVMAQDLEKIFPKAVFKGDDGFLRIRMEDMFYALVNAVKGLGTKIDLLKQKQKKIDELEKHIEKLEKSLEKLEKGK